MDYVEVTTMIWIPQTTCSEPVEYYSNLGRERVKLQDGDNRRPRVDRTA